MHLRNLKRSGRSFRLRHSDDCAVWIIGAIPYLNGFGGKSFTNENEFVASEKSVVVFF